MFPLFQDLSQNRASQDVVMHDITLRLDQSVESTSSGGGGGSNDNNNRIRNIEPNRVKALIADKLEIDASEESHIRRTTVSFEKNLIPNEDDDQLISTIEEEWVAKRDRPDVSYFFSDLYINVRFIESQEREIFVEWLRDSGNKHPVLKNALSSTNRFGSHFKRRPVTLVLQRLDEDIKADRIYRTLKSAMDIDCKLSEPREGRMYQDTKTRDVTFLADANAFRKIFLEMNRAVGYSGKSRFTFKIDARPWLCRKCNTIGRHTCKGPLCAKCGKAGHSSYKCSSSRQTCSNCKSRGHGARDTSCPMYIDAITKQLLRSDIPMEFFECKCLRMMICHGLRLK